MDSNSVSAVYIVLLHGNETSEVRKKRKSPSFGTQRFITLKERAKTKLRKLSPEVWL